MTARVLPTPEQQTELVEILESMLSRFKFGDLLSADQTALALSCMPDAANRRPIDFPAADLYGSLSPDQVKALCEIDIPGNQMNRIMPPWNSMSPQCQEFFRKKAYWVFRGSEYPTVSAFLQVEAESLFAKNTRVQQTADGEWVPAPPWKPTTLRELEDRFLPKKPPSIHKIIQRCPQMAVIHALRGDVCEPRWWAALRITEHCDPNLSRECSNGYDDFTDEELQDRVARIHREGKRPTRCTHFADISPNICDACRFNGKINSPMALGFEHEPQTEMTP